MGKFDTQGESKYMFTYMGNELCVAPQKINGITEYPDDCTFEHYDTYEECRTRILALGLDYSKTWWTP